MDVMDKINVVQSNIEYDGECAITTICHSHIHHDIKLEYSYVS
jgi:hypothetical protein